MKSFFSPETILELLNSSALTEDQISREFDRIWNFTNRDNTANSTQIADKLEYIVTQARRLSDNTDTHHDQCMGLSADINNLKQSIDVLTTRINCVNTTSSDHHGHSEPSDTVVVEPDPMFELLSSDVSRDTIPCTLTTPATSTSTINGISKPFELFEDARKNELDYLLNTPHVPYIKYSNCKKFSGPDYFKLLNEHVDYKFRINGRELAYYGEYEYRYTGVKHDARPTSDSRVIDDLCKQVKDLFPSYKFNSVLVTRYPSGESKCPPHSDDEPTIAQSSLILTISFGADRSMHVRRKMELGVDKLSLSAGALVFMSKASQTHFDHAIPLAGSDVSERVSCTFRLIEPFSKYKYSDSSNSSSNDSNSRTRLPETPQDPRRILILSDSKNLGFDTSDFRNPSIACFKEPCYTVSDIQNHEHKIARADVVLISTGINDILRGISALDIFTKLRTLVEYYSRKYPDKMFLFYAVSEVTGRYNDYNDVIEELNDFCFQMSLRLRTFKLFNNLFFDTYKHLASDGLHLSKFGKWSASIIWTQAVLCVLRIRKAALPLRPRYLEIRKTFYDSDYARSSLVGTG